MNKPRFGLTIAAAALAVSLPLAVSAQDAPPPAATPPMERMEPAPAPDQRLQPTNPSTTIAPPSRAIDGTELAMAINSDDLIGKKVKNSADQTIGQIDALLISKDSRVVGVVLDVGGFLGMGGHKVVVPMERFTIVGQNEIRLPNGSKESLRQEPAYEKPRS